MASTEHTSETADQDSTVEEVQAQSGLTQLVELSSVQNGNVEATAADNPAHPAHTDVGSDVASASGNKADTSEPGPVPSTSTEPAKAGPSKDAFLSQPSAVSASSPSSKDKADEQDRPKDAEKDRASLNTSTATYTRTQSTRRKDAKSASENAHTASTPPESPRKSKPSKKAKGKRSLFSRLFHVFVPCVAPSTRTHAVDVDVPKHQPSELVGIAQPDLKEKQTAKEAQELPPRPEPEPPLTVLDTAPPSHEEVPELASPTEDVPLKREPTPVPPPLQPIDVRSSSEDPTVVVPPTPTKSLLPRDETEGVLSGAVQPPGSTGDEIGHDPHHRHRDSLHDSDGSTSYTEDEDLEEGPPVDQIEDEEERLILQGGAGIPIGPDGVPRPLLPPLSAKHAGRKCLVLDLDETLVHSSFKSISQADYVVPVEIEYNWHNVYVIKRPGVDNFLKKMGEIYEVVVFTASLSKYADPVLDKLDIHRVVSHRLFRESCYNHRGNYVKDLSQLGRPITDTIIIDNSPASYIFHPNNAVPVSSWFNDPHDTELTDLVPFLADLSQVDDVRGVLDGGL